MIQARKPAYIVLTEAYINALVEQLQQHGITYEFKGSAALLTLAEQLADIDPVEARLFAQMAYQIASTAYAIQAGLIAAPESAP